MEEDVSGSTPGTMLSCLDLNHRWDDWVLITRMRKDTTENRELALSLRNLYTGAKSAPTKDPDTANGEKTSRKRQRDNETETVRMHLPVAVTIFLMEVIGRGLPTTTRGEAADTRPPQGDPCR